MGVLRVWFPCAHPNHRLHHHRSLKLPFFTLVVLICQPPSSLVLLNSACRTGSALACPHIPLFLCFCVFFVFFFFPSFFALHKFEWSGSREFALQFWPRLLIFCYSCRILSFLSHCRSLSSSSYLLSPPTLLALS
ncbi:hypothetical protein CROQUDRAFT_318216 [Cronartium quercuum f. sp. fusiforme G11]|uniref:Uncharacterized protein n=1 Tax=Cronartium quercuum f. sp. fusiforme G11 TaxID=708437 RepID=A0A9P6NSJ7_9BASI|nr:hypothetical protein CROQUDRAFT_318216 [Cronartium quercuum f. sp. fusiforme G11]